MQMILSSADFLFVFGEENDENTMKDKHLKNVTIDEIK